MNYKRPSIFLVFVTGCVLIASSACAVQEQKKSSKDAESNITATLYTKNFALIQQRMPVELEQGYSEIILEEVPSGLLPNSVHARFLGKKGEAYLSEQIYSYQPLNPDSLLEAYQGKMLTLYTTKERTGEEIWKKARLLSKNGPVYEIDGKIFSNPPGVPVFSEIPEDLTLFPRLKWRYWAKKKMKQEMQIAYLTRDLSWEARYILNLSNEGQFQGWASIQNQTNLSFRNIRLHLAAGQVNFSQNVNQPQPMARMQMMSADAFQEGGMTDEAVGDIYIYESEDRVSLLPNENKQITFLKYDDLAVKKRYQLKWQGLSFFYPRRQDETPQHAKVYYEFQNPAGNDGGKPIASGKVAVYDEQEGGVLTFLGEDRVQDIPAGEKISLQVGDAFDVTGLSKQLDYQKISQNVHETEWLVELNNKMTEEVLLEVDQMVPGDWRVLSASHEYIKKDSTTLRFLIPLQSKQQVQVQYKLRIQN